VAYLTESSKGGAWRRRLVLRRIKAAASWLAVVVMMAAAGSIGLGLLDTGETMAPSTAIAFDPDQASEHEAAGGDVVLAAIEAAALASPASGPPTTQLPLIAATVHTSGNASSAEDGHFYSSRGVIHRAWMSALPWVDELAAAMVTASRAWNEHYDEAEELYHEEVEQAAIQPEPVPALPAPGRSPLIAIVIDDLGLNRRQTAAVTDLPAPITMAFIPYAEDLSGQTLAAQANGHEIFLHLPMEPIDPDKDPGPNALLASLTPDELRSRLVENLDRFTGYVGVNNHMGSRLTQDSDAMVLVMAELKRRGLLFLDSLTIGTSVAYQTAERLGVPSAKRDIFLDNDPDVAAILVQLHALEAVANRDGSAIAIGHPYGATVAALSQWIPEALARGFRIVPASAIIDQRSLIVAQHTTSSPAP